MKASQLIESLTTLMRIYGDLDLVYATDDEGNSFHKITITDASICVFDDLYNEANFECEKPNAFCIN